MEIVDTGGAFVSDTGCTFVWDDMSEVEYVDLCMDCFRKCKSKSFGTQDKIFFLMMVWLI